jgi:dTDP-glucose 4,6-dehydratase
LRVAVTGSLGTLGAPLTAELRDRGHEVWGIDRRHSGEDYFLRADVANYRQLDAAFSTCSPEIVFHLAAEFGRHNGEGWYEDLWTTAAIGTRNVLELCRDFGAALRFASSSEIYGDSEAKILSESLSESTRLHQPNEYALSKWVNEEQIRNFQSRHYLDAARLRFFNAYGPGEDFHAYRSVVALFVHKALHGVPLPVYEGYHRTFMYVGDFIPTLCNACRPSLPSDVYNIGGADYRSVEELAEIVLDEVGGGEIEWIAEDTHNVRNKRPDIELAFRDLGHSPVTRLEEGVPLTVEWMRGAVRVG